MNGKARQTRGVSLIEALVALAVMAFGMLGVVGMQVSMRANSDAARQRAEAVRIAQAAVENWRAFERLDNPGGGSTALNFADIATYASQPVSGYTTNTIYGIAGTSVPVVLSGDDLKLKTVTVAVNWSDRAGQAQGLSLTSAVAGISPELAGSLALPGDRAPTQRPRGRHTAIPIEASDLGDGTSRFAPPGSGVVTWLFNNQTGYITRICNPGCTDALRLPLSGYVRFATDSEPTPPLAESPNSAAVGVTLRVTQTVPASADVDCFSQLAASYVAYFCALPVTTAPNRWSGRANLVDGIGITLATSAGDATNSRRRVCRYTTQPTDTPGGGNAAHPLDYVNVTAPLANQNFLVIKAGEGGTLYLCPTDPLPQRNTFRHQPVS